MNGVRSLYAPCPDFCKNTERVIIVYRGFQHGEWPKI